MDYEYFEDEEPAIDFNLPKIDKNVILNLFPNINDN